MVAGVIKCIEALGERCHVLVEREVAWKLEEWYFLDKGLDELQHLIATPGQWLPAGVVTSIDIRLQKRRARRRKLDATHYTQAQRRILGSTQRRTVGSIHTSIGTCFTFWQSIEVNTRIRTNVLSILTISYQK